MGNRVFISYAHDDRDWAARLKTELDSRGFATFLDYDSLRAGGSWEDQLRGELDACDHLAVLWSKPAQASDWVQRERGRFDAMRYKGKQRLPGHVMIHIQLDNRESAYGADQAVTDITEAAYQAGAQNLPADIWRALADRVAEGLGEDSIPVTTAVVTLTQATLSQEVDFNFRPPAGRTLAELLADIQMTRETLSQNLYGLARSLWKPFGGNATIAQILDQMRVALNAPQGVTPVRWVPVDDDLFSDQQEGIDRAAAKLASGLALLIIDPIALYSPGIRALLDQLDGCYQNPYAAIVVLPVFPLPPQPRAHHNMVRQVYRRLVNLFYEEAPLSARIEYAQCSVLAADDADVRRMVRHMLRHYLGKAPSESANKFLTVRR
jgi:hypothetical protein